MVRIIGIIVVVILVKIVIIALELGCRPITDQPLNIMMVKLMLIIEMHFLL